MQRQSKMLEHRAGKSFPPEADGDFGLVSDEKIEEWRASLAERFGIGSGEATIIEEPAE